MQTEKRYPIITKHISKIGFFDKMEIDVKIVKKIIIFTYILRTGYKQNSIKIIKKYSKYLSRFFKGYISRLQIGK